MTTLKVVFLNQYHQPMFNRDSVIAEISSGGKAINHKVAVPPGAIFATLEWSYTKEEGASTNAEEV